jgi:dTDP-4-dehydrorhamnose reductase
LKVLLFGKTGSLGRALEKKLLPVAEVIALNATSQDYCGDLNDLAGISDTVLRVRPDVLINAAAWTDVDRAETLAADVFRVNALAPAAMAAAVKRLGGWMLHYSTDYVFSGLGETAWAEDDDPAPLNIYGQSKLEGDRLMHASGVNHVTFRLSWLCSNAENGFVARIIRQARGGMQLSVVNDQVGAPTSTDWVAQISSLAAQRMEGVLPDRIDTGLYNLAANGETTRYDYARYVLECAVQRGYSLKVSPDSVVPILSGDDGLRARRPNNSRLATTKFKRDFALDCPPWQVGVAQTVRELVA